MLKPKKPINVGDKIEWVDGFINWCGVVTRIAASNENVLDVKTDVSGNIYVHRRQITKVIRRKKKEKREPRVVVEIQWGVDGINKCLHFSEDSAIKFMQTERPGVRYKLVKFVEVLEGEEK